MVNKQPIFDFCLGGLETEQEYPYDAVDEKCKFKKSEAVVYVNGSVSISKDETSKLHLHNFCQTDFGNLLHMYICTFVHTIEINFPHSGKTVHKFGQSTLCNLKKEVRVIFPEQLRIITPNLFSFQLFADVVCYKLQFLIISPQICEMLLRICRPPKSISLK